MLSLDCVFLSVLLAFSHVFHIARAGLPERLAQHRGCDGDIDERVWPAGGVRLLLLLREYSSSSTSTAFDATLSNFTVLYCLLRAE